MPDAGRASALALASVANLASILVIAGGGQRGLVGVDPGYRSGVETSAELAGSAHTWVMVSSPAAMVANS